MGYYEKLKERDIIIKLKRLLQGGGYHVRDDGKIAGDHRVAWDQPWQHVRQHPMLDCHTWHSILFDVIVAGLPPEEKFVPSMCQQCYKVVVRPKTVKQLFGLLELQKRVDRPSKCGIETRETVHGLYGGYFYNVGLEEGLNCYRIVRDAVNKDPILGPDVVVILKRGCTEYEHALGASDKWQVTERQLEIEAMLDTILAKDNVRRVQSEHNLQYIHLKWIEWAWAHGDPTYAEFTDGPLYPPYVTYHHLSEGENAKR